MLNDNSNTPRPNGQKPADDLKTYVERDIARATEAAKRFTAYAQAHAEDAAELQSYAPETAEVSRYWQQFYLDKVAVIKADLDKLLARLEAL